MTTTAEKLQDLIAAKRDMKEAIESKGGTVTGGLSTYADAIDKIETNADDLVSFPEGTKFVYSNCETLPDFIIKHLENITDWSHVFMDSNINVVPLIDASHVINAADAFRGGRIGTIKGLKNLGANKNCKYTTEMFDNPYDITRESMLNIINNLYDRASVGYSVLTLKFGVNLDDLTDEEIAIATNKGWILE
jgi:hypothetical protein